MSAVGEERVIGAGESLCSSEGKFVGTVSSYQLSDEAIMGW